MKRPFFQISTTPDLVQWFSAQVHQHGLLAYGDRVLVAVSGGPDSVALLYLLTRIRPEMGLDLGVGHFDHCLRGQDSRGDAEFVAHLAQELALPFYLGHGDVKEEARSKKISLQMAARRLRLNFLKDICRSQAYNKLALGHTADDQVEQFFLRLFRGAGLEGLKGMWPLTPDGLVRPLLAVGKEVILAWLHHESLPYRDDASNVSRRYLRNRVRLDLLPELARHYNPRVKNAVWRLMTLLQEDEHLLAEQTRQAWKKTGQMVTRDVISLHLPDLLHLPPGLQKRVLRFALGKLTLDQEITSTQVENILALGRAQKSGGQISLGECQVARAGQELHIWRGLPPPPVRAATTLSTVPGQVDSPEGWRWQVRQIAEIPRSHQEGSPFTVWLDEDRLSFPLRLRYVQPGDRFRPHGSPGTRKLQDFLVDSKIPRWLRPHIPLVESAGQIVWVVGLRTADLAAPTSNRKTCLEIQVSATNSYAESVMDILLALPRAGKR